MQKLWHSHTLLILGESIEERNIELIENANSTDYSEPAKKAVRKKSIKYAIDLLTTKRESIAVVPAYYLKKCTNYLNDKEMDNSQVRNLLSSLSFSKACKNWEQLWSCHISKKQAKDITVAYLAGPNPLNDFEIFIKNGVLPENIWAFEADNNTFQEALGNIKNSEFHKIKINKIKIQNFFKMVPKTFDLIYIDACGPLPSKDQNTLKILSSIFYYHRLASPGILITNFANPLGNTSYSSQSVQPVQNSLIMSYTSLISAYLYPKSFLENLNDENYNLDEGAVAYGFSCSSELDDNETDFRYEVSKKFEDYYGQYITRQLFDLSSILIPFTRLCDSYEENNHHTLWSLLVKDSPNTLIEYAKKMKTLTESYDGGDFIIDPDMYSLGAFIMNIENYSDIVEGAKKIYSVWKRQISLNPKISVDDSILIHEALKSPQWLIPEVLEALKNCNFSSAPYLCDIPTFMFLLYPILAQYIHPMHPNIKKVKRFTYKAKDTQMFTDIIPFDECRYVYDYLPSSVLLNNIINEKTDFFVYLLALDGIQKQLIRYMNILYGCTTIGVNNKGFHEAILQKRIKIN